MVASLGSTGPVLVTGASGFVGLRADCREALQLIDAAALT
jgi:nucleoside-diphosphate-sugar epimerase